MIRAPSTAEFSTKSRSREWKRLVEMNALNAVFLSFDSSCSSFVSVLILEVIFSQPFAVLSRCTKKEGGSWFKFISDDELSEEIGMEGDETVIVS